MECFFCYSGVPSKPRACSPARAQPHFTHISLPVPEGCLQTRPPPRLGPEIRGAPVGVDFPTVGRGRQPAQLGRHFLRPTTVGRHPGALGSDNEGTRLHPGMAFFPHHVSSVLVTSWQ